MPCDAAPKGSVCEQSPAEGLKVDKNSVVKVKVSTGPSKVAVPNVMHLAIADAEKALQDKGFQIEKKTVESERPAGTVIEQNPKSGEADKGSTVTVTVAKEISKVTVPDLSGKTQADASKALEALNLKLGSVTEVDAAPGTAPKTVVSQDPGPNGQVTVGSSVNISVAKPVQQLTVPNLFGKTINAARAELALRAWSSDPSCRAPRTARRRSLARTRPSAAR